MPKHNLTAREFYGQISRFYTPLAIQAASQSMTYLLVGSIVARGAFGTKGFGAFAQGLIMLAFFGAVERGLIATGMMFAKSKSGFAVFRRLVLMVAVAIFAAQLASCFGPMRILFFRVILGLEGEYEEIARMAVLTGIPMQLAFLFRNISLVALFNIKKSAIANYATMIRVAATAMLAYVFPMYGLVGHLWGMLAMTVPVFGEAFLTMWFARKHIANLTDKPGEETAPFNKQLYFTMPLSLGGMMLSASVFIVAAALAQTKPDPRLIAAIHYVVMGVANPLGFAALRMQAAVIAFPPAEYGRRRVALFAFGVGAVLVGLLLLFQIPAVARWYFCDVQRLDPENLRLATGMLLVMTLYPFLQSLRGLTEGVAALRHRPAAVFAGQVAYLVTMAVSLKYLLGCEWMPAHMMGATAILVGIAATMGTISIALRFKKIRRIEE